MRWRWRTLGFGYVAQAVTMRNSPDPSEHRAREQQIMAHVERLLDDPRLMIDTTSGRRGVPQFIRHVSRNDRATDVKRLMSEMNRPDRELQEQMPRGESIDVTLQQTKWLVLKQTVGRLRVICALPDRQLIAGETPEPLGTSDVRKIIQDLSGDSVVPTTIVLVSTSGFTLEAHELAERRPDRTVIFVEPNDAGGWSVHGPVETKALVDLFDPEAEDEKCRRVRAAIDAAQTDLLTGGIATDKLAAKTALPLQTVEAEVKSYAKENPGLVAKRLDGRVVLFREGTAPMASSTSKAVAGGGSMPLIDRIKALFNRKGENEKKIAFLSERRAALAQQRDRSYEEIGTLEQKDEELQKQFKDVASPVTRRRITTQLVQLRKELERRQQLVAVLNQQINVVSTHLHNIELVAQGAKSELPDSEEIASDAAAAEEMLAELQANNELADSVGAVAHAGMTDEEQALYEELERGAGGGETTSVKLDPHASEDEIEPPAPRVTKPRPAESAPPEKPAPRRTEPEAG